MRARRRTRRWRHTSGPSPTLGGRACRTSSSGGAPSVASTARHPCRSCSRGSTRTSHEQGGIMSSRLPGRGAGDARSLRRGTRDPRRNTCGAGRARRGNLLATITGFESAGVELLAGDPAAAAELGAEGCRLLEELGDRGFLSSAAGKLGAGALRARPARRGRRLGRPRCGARRERRRVHADALAAGQGEGARASRRARRSGAARPRGGRDRRRDRHARRRKATRTPTSPRCSCSPAGPTRRPPRSSRRSSATSARATSSRPQRTKARLAELHATAMHSLGGERRGVLRVLVLRSATAAPGGPRTAKFSGRTWDRTGDLPRVKRALSR